MDPSHESQAAAPRHFPVAVLLERRPATSPWIEHVWSAIGIAVGRHGDPQLPRLVHEQHDVARYLVGGLGVTLHADECESYYYNLVSDTPRAYVLAHATGDGAQPEPFRVSMSFDEAHAYLEGDDQIYAVDVPPELYRWTEAFVIENYFPAKRQKRKLREWTAEESGQLPR